MRKFLRNLILSDGEQKKLAQNTKTFHVKPIGSSGTENYSGYYYEEYLDALKSQDKAEIYDKMRRSDTQIKMNLSAVKNPIKSAEWFIKDPNPDDERSKMIADFVEFIIFKDMDTPFTKFLREALTMIEHGNSIFEVTHKVVKFHPIWGAYNGIRALDWRSPKTIERFNLDKDSGRLESIDQYAYGDLDRQVRIPAEFLVLFALDVEGSNYEGISMLRSCYGAWLRKQTYLKLNAIGIEKFAVPTPLVKIPEGFSGDEGYDTLVDTLEDYVVHENNYLIYPEGVEINLNTNTYDPEKVEKSVMNEETRMTKAFLANFLELGTGGSGGAYALSNDLSDFFMSGLEHIANEIAETFTRRVIVPLVDMNFGVQDEYPELSFSDLSDKTGEEFARMLNDLTKAKVIQPDDELESFVRKKMKLPEASLVGQRKIEQTSLFSEDKMSLSERMIRATYGKKG